MKTIPLPRVLDQRMAVAAYWEAVRDFAEAPGHAESLDTWMRRLAVKRVEIELLSLIVQDGPIRTATHRFDASPDDGWLRVRRLATAAQRLHPAYLGGSHHAA